MATPLAITAAMGCASRNGILVRDSRVLETLQTIDTIIFDKTGTITEGKFSLLEIALAEVRFVAPRVMARACIGGTQQSLAPENSESSEWAQLKEILSLVASLEQYSEHPLGRAVAEFARRNGVRVHDATSVQIRKGYGLTGTVEDKQVFAGNRQLLRQLGNILPDDLDRRARTWEQEGKTVAFFGCDGDVLAVAAFGDTIKAEASPLISHLHRMGINVQLLSGDAAATTNWIGRRLGIDSCQSEVLPEEKVEAVRGYQRRGAVVAMVGDGVNDAPALAQADLGIALGSGTDIAMKAASVVLMNGDLDKIADVLTLAQKTFRIVRQNLFWAFFYNAVGITLAVFGILNPIMAAFAMLFSSLSVVGNSMRLARKTI
jgi:heavy metal translocating P-type ATPase